MGNLAETFRAQGDLEGALLLRKCLLGQRKIRGEKHPDTIATAEFLMRLEARPQASRPSG